MKYSLLILLPVGLFLWAAFEFRGWDEEFTIEDGRPGTARFTYLKWRFWGSPHVISFGGETLICAGTFRLDEHRSRWKSRRDERVFAVQFREQRWYVISLDRTDGHRWVIRFYSGKDGETLKEIEPHDYPLKLAIQNLWLSDEDEKVLSAFSAGDYWTRTSVLAKRGGKWCMRKMSKKWIRSLLKRSSRKNFLGELAFCHRRRANDRHAAERAACLHLLKKHAVPVRE